jgi:hypothetical protein
MSPNHGVLVNSKLNQAKLWMLADPKALRRLPLHARPPQHFLNVFHAKIFSVLFSFSFLFFSPVLSCMAFAALVLFGIFLTLFYK